MEDQDNNEKIKLHTHGQLIYDNRGENVRWEKTVSLQQMALGKLDIHMQKNEIEHLDYAIYKN